LWEGRERCAHYYHVHLGGQSGVFGEVVIVVPRFCGTSATMLQKGVEGLTYTMW
jgi:hypothetical protein